MPRSEMRRENRIPDFAALHPVYGLPTAPGLPRIEIVHLETPSPLNPIGVKGAGEGGTIPAAPCIISAIEDALAPFGVVIDRQPVSPENILDLIEAGPGNVATSVENNPKRL